MYVMEWNISTYKDQTSQRVLKQHTVQNSDFHCPTAQNSDSHNCPTVKKSDSMQKGKKIFPQ